MGYAARRIKDRALRFLRSPGRTLVELGRRFSPVDRKQVSRLAEVTREAPLILQIETTNACNARCRFCAHPSMQRKTGVMDLALFEKVVGDYASMGGGPVSLTPIVGDALLDPHLLERLRLLGSRPEVNQISLTTNGIALERYSDDEVRTILTSLDCIQLSVGGLDAQTYRALYGVDRFAAVRASMERLLKLKERLANPAALTFAFRTGDWRFESRHARQLEEFGRRGVFVSHIWTYANYSGVIRSEGGVELDVVPNAQKKSETCVYPCVHLAICWDGRITACGCADFEGERLGVGTVQRESLAAVWSGPRRAEVLDSFSRGKPFDICRECSAYEPASSVYARPYCRDVLPHHPLPLEYFRRFWGG